MSDNAVVSVIVPIFNVAGYLEQCIESILGQTYDRMQIILVDDGSADVSGRICDRFAAQDSRVIVVHKNNEGLVAARKTGLFRASGRYICYVDGDDWIETDLIEHLVGDMLRTGADLVVSDYFCEAEDSFRKVACRLENGLYDAEAVIPIMLCRGGFYEFGISQFVWAKLFRRDILWDVQMQVDNRICCGEDVAVTYPYILQTEKLYLSDYAGYHYRQRTDSMTNDYRADEYNRNKILLEYLQRIFNGSAYSEYLNRQLNQYAKNLLLVRQTGFFDTPDTDTVLSPYGGIPVNARLVIYGAGKLGQSIYHYLKRQSSIEIVEWLDQNYRMYQKMNFEVHSPEKLKEIDERIYEYIVIAISNKNAADDICRDLADMGIERKKIRYLNMNFISEKNNVLDMLWLK